MEEAIDEMTRRRQIQLTYNKENNISPTSIQKSIQHIMENKESDKIEIDIAEEEEIYGSEVPILELINKLEKQMLSAAKNLEFEKATKIRDRIKKMREKDLKIIIG